MCVSKFWRNLNIFRLNPHDLAVTPGGNGISRVLVADERLAHAATDRPQDQF